MSAPAPVAVGLPVEPQETPAKLPLDPRTIMINVRSRWRAIILGACVSMALGAGLAKLIGHKVFEASTVLLYKEPAGAGPESDGNEAPSLLTQLDMLKIPDNLEQVRHRLKLKSSIDKLGTAITAEVPINSSLLEIKVQWNSAEGAASIANTVRDVFLANQLAVQHRQAAAKIRDLEVRLDRVQQDLHTSEENLKAFTIKHHVVDLDKEAGWYLQQLINVELVYEEATGESRAVKLQEANMGRIVDELKNKVRDEENQLTGDGDNSGSKPGDAAAKPAGMAANPTLADSEIRGRIANLKVKEADMERDRQLRDEGILSEKEYEKSKASYEAEKFALYNNSPSAGLLKEMTLKELMIKLEGISDQQKVAQLKSAVDRVRERLDGIPLVEREYLALQREVAVRAAERERIGQFLGLARRQNESQAFGFAVVSEARPPVLPTKSNRRLVFLAVAFLGSFMSFAVVLAKQAIDRRMFSIGDAKAKLKTEVLAGFPANLAYDPSVSDNALDLVNKLRGKGLERGSRLLVVSPSSGEGATDIAMLLARTLAATGDSCVLIDANFRPQGAPSDVPAETISGKGNGTGLSDGNRRRTLPATALKSLRRFWNTQTTTTACIRPELCLSELNHAAELSGFSDMLASSSSSDLTVPMEPNLRFLPSGTRHRPVLLLSPRIGDVVNAVATRKDIAVIHTAPVLAYPDATLLNSVATSAVVVFTSGKLTAGVVESSVGLLEGAGIRVLGTVLTGITSAYEEVHQK